MVLLASTFDQSKYLRAEDLKQEKTLRIKLVTAEAINDRTGQMNKLVVSFTNTEKKLVLNKTNNRTIRAAYGDDTAGWAGKLIVVFPTQVDFGGRMVAALRVRIPPPKREAGNGQTVRPQPVQAEAAAAHPTRATPELVEDDDFDDEIPI